MMFIRTYFGTSLALSKYLKRESRFLNKIMSHNKPALPTKVVNTVPSLFPEKSDKVINKRRMTVLNKLFMKSITDIISAGNMDHSIIEQGFQITKVAITPDFKYINVLYHSPTLQTDENIDHKLNIAAQQIHHELSQLRLMGYVPKINFLRDRTKSKIEEVEALLNTITSTLGKDDYDTELPVDLNNDNIPEMVSNVYGLEHDKIMNKIIIATSIRSNRLKQTDEEESTGNHNLNKREI